MSLQTPTTADVSANIIAQLEASLNQSIPLLPKSFMRVLAKVLAAVVVILYKYSGFMFLQIFVQTATLKETEVNGEFISPLTFWGRLIGVGDPTKATAAEMVIDINVETQTGILASGSQLLASTNGFTYATIGDVTLNAPVVQAIIRAVSDQTDGNGLGALGNLSNGQTLNFANPLPNVAREVTVASQLIAAADAEALEVYRDRVITRFQTRPQGGAYADYVIWGEEVAGIVNIYPYTSVTPGIVEVYAEATVASSGSADGIPTAAQLTAVAASIELDDNGLASRRPAGAFVNVVAITRKGFDVNITGLVVDNPAQVQADVEAQLTQYFLDREPFISGLSFGVRTDRVTRSGVAGDVEDIVTGAGGLFTSITLDETVGPNGIEIYSLIEGEKAKLVTLTWL